MGAKTNAVSERAKWQFYYVIYATTGFSLGSGLKLGLSGLEYTVFSICGKINRIFSIFTSII